MNKIEKNMARPLSNEELYEMMNGNIKIVIYPELINYNSIEELLYPYGAVIILYLMKSDTGHWVTLFRYPNSNKIEFFDPYGKKPDYGLKLIPIVFREENNMYYPHLTWLMSKYNGPVEYNNYKFQELNPLISTCGRWVLTRLYFKDKTLKQFKKMFLDYPKKIGLSPDEYVTLFSLKIWPNF